MNSYHHKETTMNSYIHIGADSAELPEDAPGHTAVRIEHPLLAKPITVTSFKAPTGMTQDQAQRWADGLETNGWNWRLPTVEEGFFIPDRSKYPATSKIHFPDLEDYEVLRTSTPDPESPASYAFVVSLRNGSVLRIRPDLHYSVRAVRAGQ